MSNADPHDETSTQPAASPAEEAPRRRRNPWVWASGLLALKTVVPQPALRRRAARFLSYRERRHLLTRAARAYRAERGLPK